MTILLLMGLFILGGKKTMNNAITKILTEAVVVYIFAIQLNLQ